MGFLDSFRRPKPSTTGKPKAESGRGQVDGYLVPDELNPQLSWPLAAKVYDEMWRTDPDVRRSLTMLINPIAGATWEVEPFGGERADEKARSQADAVSWALFDHMRPRWKTHVATVIRTAGRYGFAPFEQVWEAADYEGKTLLAPKTLAYRLPSSIYRWEQEGEDLTAIWQASVTKADVRLDATDLVYYRFGAEGDNWLGESLLRAAYKPWKIKDTLELVDSIAHERFAIGVPIVYPPMAPDAGDLNRAQEAVSNIRANEQGYIVAPGPKAGAGAPEGAGWLFEILTPSGGSESARLSESLKYHSDKIAAVMVEEFMRLGQAGVGARATAEIQDDPFMAYVMALADLVIADAVNATIVPRFVALNFPDADGLPRLRPSLFDATPLDQLAQFIAQITTAGALHPDDDLEDFLRLRADLPPADPQARQERSELDKRNQEAGAQAAENLASGNQPAAPGSNEPSQEVQAEREDRAFLLALAESIADREPPRP